MSKDILVVKKLTKYYGATKGVENLSFSLQEGEILGFMGLNGAGKSTTIRSIMNLINKTKGEVLVYNRPFTKDDVNLKAMIGYLPSEIHLYEDLLVKEMLDYHESFFTKDIHKRREELVQRLKIDETKKIGDLSLGNLKKVGIVLAFMHEPKIIILDEPTSGLDPVMQNVFYELMKEEKKKGTSIFYSTHILSEVSKVCDRVGIIKDGHLLKIEDVKELSNKNLTLVTIVSNEIDRIVQQLTINILAQEKDKIKFKNMMTPNELLRKLSKYNIDKILIEEASLEDIFLHYYE